jgi:hypothetical protein
MPDTDRAAVETWYFAGDPSETAVAQTFPHLGAGIEAARPPVVDYPVAAEKLFRQVVEVAAAEADAAISLASNPQRVAEYLEVVDIHDREAAYCGAGVAWAVCKAYCDANGVSYSNANRVATLRSVRSEIDRLYFLTHAWVPSTLSDAVRRGSGVASPSAIALSDLRPGYLVCFNWRNDTEHAPWPSPQHIGLVASVDERHAYTIEFNTTFPSGPHAGQHGAVARQSRLLATIVGYVLTY